MSPLIEPLAPKFNFNHDYDDDYAAYYNDDNQIIIIIICFDAIVN